MYLIIDRESQAILHMSNSFPGEDRQPEEIFPEFDPETMDFGRAAEQFIPLRYAIENGVVKDLEPPAAPLVENLAQARERTLLGFSDLALSLRRQLLPDYQMLNAGIGLYDDNRVQTMRETVQAFRSEYQRLEKMVAEAGSVEELAAIKPAFPTALASPTAGKVGKT